MHLFTHILLYEPFPRARVIAGKSAFRAAGRRVQGEREDQWGVGVGCCGDRSSEDK